MVLWNGVIVPQEEFHRQELLLAEYGIKKIAPPGMAELLTVCTETRNAQYSFMADLGDAPERFNCLTLMMWTFKRFGMEVASLLEVATCGTKVSVNDMLPADLVFTHGIKTWITVPIHGDIGHVGMKTKYVWLTLKDNMLVASAGIDASNANGKLILLPKNSFATAGALCAALKKRFGLKDLGVLITDSRLLPLRVGALAYAIGYQGFKGVRDNRGKPDIFGRTLVYSETDIADGLATAAVLEMGEGAEQIPLAIITNPPVEWTDEPADPRELCIPPEEDVYRPFFERLVTRGGGEKHTDTPLNDDQ